ncbi:MAG: helix-turn-helix transcriptional regulator [Actinomycetota bacterium]|nr:helix-turn-helix transcriptional regulator [Actinomycetota bacterium]
MAAADTADTNVTVVDPVAMPPGVTIDLEPSGGFTWHAHREHQLAFASRGLLVMGAGGRTWVLPPSRALWIPAGVRHSVAAEGATTMLGVYVPRDRCPLRWTDPTAIDASGLVGELIVHLGRGDVRGGARRRAEAVLWDVVRPLDVSALPTPMPTDERARRVADALLADPTDGRDLAAWGRQVGASGRTLARLFAAETGLTFGRWRTNARLAAALAHLGAGSGVAATARRVGYATPSAFVAAFRRELGTTPARYTVDAPPAAGELDDRGSLHSGDARVTAVTQSATMVAGCRARPRPHRTDAAERPPPRSVGGQRSRR